MMTPRPPLVTVMFGARMQHRRQLWYWVNYVFNRVDSSRVEAVGPDRAAAEWILRLGGSVKFQTFDHWNSDYNLLPSGSLHLQAINGTGLAITNNGLEHLDGLEHIQTLVLSKCRYIYDDGLALLHLVKSSLLHLDLSYCTGLTTGGLGHLTVLKRLQLLDITGIHTTESSLQLLRTSLPHCIVQS